MDYLRDNENRTFAMPRPPIDVAPLIGTWRNTNEKPIWIAGLRVDDSLRISVRGGVNGSPEEWGSATATHLYGSSLDSPTAGAWRATFDLGFCTADLEANLNQGLLVIATFVRMKDGSGRADSAVREFFHQV